MAPSRVSNFQSKSLIASYIVDWAIIALIAIVGAVFTYIPPQHRYFTLSDATISFPYQAETVTIATLVLVAVFAPALITMLISLIFVPGPTTHASIPRALRLRRKLWEWNAAWLGLALSIATAFMITQGIKNVAGKPRPNMLARCDPDLAAVARWQAGGVGNPASGSGVQLVGYGICRNSDKDFVNEGFMSFPSGHSSVSWAGLAYLTFFLCAKFAITIPYLLPGRYTSSAFPSRAGATTGAGASAGYAAKQASSLHSQRNTPPTLRSVAAAPPTYLLALVLIPICTAIFISVSRYSDYYHHGFDVLFGSLLGLLTAWASFRWYHAPIQRGAGWAWAPRSVSKAWGVGLGVQGFGEEDDAAAAAAGEESFDEPPRAGNDLEARWNGGQQGSGAEATEMNDMTRVNGGYAAAEGRYETPGSMGANGSTGLNGTHRV